MERAPPAAGVKAGQRRPEEQGTADDTQRSGWSAGRIAAAATIKVACGLQGGEVKLARSGLVSGRDSTAVTMASRSSR
jgi:hypothetical protein